MISLYSWFNLISFSLPYFPSSLIVSHFVTPPHSVSSFEFLILGSERKQKMESNFFDCKRSPSKVPKRLMYIPLQESIYSSPVLSRSLFVSRKQQYCSLLRFLISSKLRLVVVQEFLFLGDFSFVVSWFELIFKIVFYFISLGLPEVSFEQPPRSLASASFFVWYIMTLPLIARLVKITFMGEECEHVYELSSRVPSTETSFKCHVRTVRDNKKTRN